MENEKTLAQERKEIIEELVKKISVSKDNYYMSTYDVAVEKVFFANWVLAIIWYSRLCCSSI